MLHAFFDHFQVALTSALTVVRRNNANYGGSSLKRVRLFRELQSTCQVVVCQLRINQVPFGAVTECYIIEAYEY